MVSMTGYGRGAAGAKWGKVTAECSSVNRKQSEVVVQLPREFSALEPKIRETAAAAITRGRLQVVIAAEGASDAAVGINFEAAAALHEDLKKVRAKLGLKGDISLDMLLRHPSVYRSSAGLPAPESAWPVVAKALKTALSEMRAMRRREGSGTKKDLLRRLKQLGRLADRIARRAPEIPRRHRKTLLEKIRAANLPIDASGPRLLEEIALFGERCDIAEEIARLQSHLGEFASKLEDDGPCGRPLEFLSQEIFRELNTTGAKSGDAEIQRLVVDSKSELEKIREQLANVE